MNNLLVQTVVPDFRKEFLEVVVRELDGDFLLVAGPEYFDGTTLTRVDLEKNQLNIKNSFLLKRRLLIQHLPFLKILRARHAVFELNPRILSTWPLLMLRRLLGQSSAVWGHAWSRKGRGKGTTRLRDAMARLAGNVIAYTESDARDFKERLPKSVSVYAAPNALYKKEFIYARTVGEPCQFLFIGRLVPAKKPELVLRAFAKISNQAPDAKLTLVGDGPLRKSLETLADELSIKDKTTFAGHISDREVLEGYFARALATLSPGYVGLSATQSFSFGVPMILADDEPHSPEIEAINISTNASYFKANDAESLGKVMLEFWNERHLWIERRVEIAKSCQTNYSSDRMAQGFLDFYRSQIV